MLKFLSANFSLTEKWWQRLSGWLSGKVLTFHQTGPGSIPTGVWPDGNLSGDSGDS